MRPQSLTPFGGTAAAATPVVVTRVPSTAQKRIKIGALSFGYSAAAPAAPTQATVSDGTTTLYFAIGANPAIIEMTGPLEFLPGATVTITLPSGGGATVGSVAGGSFED